MAKEPKFDGRPVWAEISTAALEHNLRAIRARVGDRRVLCIVKANAYGHGATGVAKALERAGADCFGVTCVAEGVELRDTGIRKPILVLTGCWPGEEKNLLAHRLTPAITRLEQLRDLDRAAKKLKAKRPAEFHLKVDTGMNRLGITPADVKRFIADLADCKHVRMAGIFTHFASAEDFEQEQTERQQMQFAEVLKELRASRVDHGIAHMANSAGIAARPNTWADMVRPGAILYGYHQFYHPPEREAEMRAKMELQPALSLRTRVILLRDVPAGEGVGYNARFIPGRASRVAVIAAGYADGLVRQRCNRDGKNPVSKVIVRGRCAPLVGTISMDLAMVDMTDVPGVAVGDVVTIYGADGCAIHANDVARELGTVTSDLLCAIGKRVPRFYLP